MAASDEWRSELEAQQNLLTKQQSQIDAQWLQINTLQKKLGCAPEDDAEVDLPAAEYNRVFAATVALLVYNVASIMVSSFTAGGIEGNLSQAEYLLWPLCSSRCVEIRFQAPHADSLTHWLNSTQVGPLSSAFVTEPSIPLKLGAVVYDLCASFASPTLSVSLSSTGPLVFASRLSSFSSNFQLTPFTSHGLVTHRSMCSEGGERSRSRRSFTHRAR